MAISVPYIPFKKTKVHFINKFLMRLDCLAIAMLNWLLHISPEKVGSFKLQILPHLSDQNMTNYITCIGLFKIIIILS